MDINNLKAFIEVADKRSFSRSAETLSLTQPAVSKRIAALELELSAKLFDRVGRTVHLTEAGRVLLPSARQISAELSRIEDVICNLGNDVSGKLSIGTSEYIGTRHLPEILKPFREQYPNVDLDLHFANSKETLAAIEDGEIEMALCSTPDNGSLAGHPKLRSVQIWSEALVIVCSNDHPLVSTSPLTLDVLAKCPAILPPGDSNTRKSIENILHEHNLRTIVSMEVNDFDTMKSMSAIGLGWACLPSFVVDDTLKVLPIDALQIKHSVALVRHQNRTLSRAAQAFLKALPGSS